jgi:ankyrin repeat protein
VVKMLLAKDGVDPDSKDEYGRTPLLWAAQNRREEVMELLRREGRRLPRLSGPSIAFLADYFSL